MATHFPRLAVLEWITFAAVAAALAVMNVYTTLLTGWADTGSILAVLGSALFLGMFGRRISVERLNLGQTMASAGGSVGFAAAAYAALKMARPDYEADPVLLAAMFLGLGILSTVIGATVRRSMVRYYFPSGTACAAIQKTIVEGREDGKRAVRILAIWGAISALWTVPVKTATTPGGHGILSKLSLSWLRVFLSRLCP